MPQVNAQAIAGPPTMTLALEAGLRAEGYRLPATWPDPARVVLWPEAGWRLHQAGSLTTKQPPEYIAPDGVVYIECRRGARPRIVALSKRTGPLLLRPKKGQHLTRWVGEEAETVPPPDHLRPYLFSKRGA